VDVVDGEIAFATHQEADASATQAAEEHA